MRTQIAFVGVVLLCMGLGSPLPAQDKPTGTPTKGPASAAKADGSTLYEIKGCAYCHGMDGRKTKGSATPIVAGQKPGYTHLVLRAYKSGERLGLGGNAHAEYLEQVSDEEMKLLADHIATLK